MDYRKALRKDEQRGKNVPVKGGGENKQNQNAGKGKKPSKKNFWEDQDGE